MTARIIKLIALAVGTWVSAATVSAQSDIDFKGKTIRLIIGTSTGGGVDLYARLVAQFLGKHLPGEPVIVAQNMPGASSVVAANYLFRSRNRTA
jgi:tripartite-type tricarboxylate transporter receptor subunit TctC